MIRKTFFAWTLVLVLAIPTPQLCWSQQQHGSPDFMSALMDGNLEKAAQFIVKNPKLVNNPLGHNEPPLVATAQWDKTEIVKLLVTNNADVNAHGVWGKT